MKNYIFKLDQNRRSAICQLIKSCALLVCTIAGLSSLSATAQIPLKNIMKVESGYIHTCALTTTGAVRCWGGASGGPTNPPRLMPGAVVGLTSGVTAISTGMGHSCALMDTGGVKCWGNNTHGQLGNNSTTRQTTPVDVVGLTSGVIAISAGNEHTCALTNTGEVKCWGYNLHGQLGDGTKVDQTTPVSVIGLGASAISISAGNVHTCALTELKGVKCWGKNNGGQLGDNTNNDSLIPVDVYTLATGVAKINAGSMHSCALLTNGKIKCWGTNYDGRVGNNSTSNINIPVDLAGSQPVFIDVAAGATTTCGLTNLGGIKCWGANESGQLGIGSTTRSLVPLNVPGFTSGVTALSANNLNGCAVKNSGVYCWGSNINGTVGDNTTQNRLAPVAVLQAFSTNIGVATPGNGQAFVSFTPPADDSGYPVTGYTVISTPAGGIDIDAGTIGTYTGPNELTHLITGLVNGNSYTFSVVATNALGQGLPSLRSNVIVPFGSSSRSSQQSSVVSSVASSNAALSSSLSSSSISSSIVSSSVVSSSSSSVVNNSNCNSETAVFGSTHSGALAATDCRNGTRGANYYVDRYSFSGVAGQQISIQLASIAFDTYVILKNASNTVITFNDDSGGSSNSRIPASASTYTLPTTGDFTIEVTSFSSLNVGAYTLLLSTPAPASPCNPVTPIEDERDTYGALETTDCTNGARGVGYYTDSYYFIGIAGERIIIDYIAGFNSYVYLRNPTGAVIASDSGSGVLINSRIPASGTLTLPTSGIYVIEATSSVEFKTGGYRLLLTSN